MEGWRVETQGSYPLASRPPDGLDARAQLEHTYTRNWGCSPFLSRSNDPLDGKAGNDANGSTKAMAGMQSEVRHAKCSIDTS